MRLLRSSMAMAETNKSSIPKRFAKRCNSSERRCDKLDLIRAMASMRYL